MIRIARHEPCDSHLEAIGKPGVNRAIHTQKSGFGRSAWRARGISPCPVSRTLYDVDVEEADSSYISRQNTYDASLVMSKFYRLSDLNILKYHLV